MNELNLKNAAIAITSGLLVFAVLLQWAPLANKGVEVPRIVVLPDNSFSKDLSIDELKDLLYAPPDGNSRALTVEPTDSSTPKEQIDPNTLDKICKSRSNVNENSTAFAEVRRQVGAAQKSKKEKQRMVAILDEFMKKTQDLCADWEPEP